MRPPPTGEVVLRLAAAFLSYAFFIGEPAKAQAPKPPHQDFTILVETATASIDKEWIQPVISNLRRHARADPKILSLLDTVLLETRPRVTPEPNAFADWDRNKNRPWIGVDAQFIAEYSFLADLYALVESDHPQATAITRQVGADHDRRILAALRAKRPLPNIDFQLEKFLNRQEEISGVRLVALQAHRDFATWVVLHEIAHHLLDHLRPSAWPPEKQREQEIAADRLAFELMNRMNFSLVRLKGMFSIIGAGELRAKALGLKYDENRRTHPTWQARAENLGAFMRHNPPPAAVSTTFVRSRFSRAAAGGQAALMTAYLTFPQQLSISGNYVGMVNAEPHVFIAATDWRGPKVHLYWRPGPQFAEAIIENPAGHTSVVTIRYRMAEPGQEHSYSVEMMRESFGFIENQQLGPAKIHELLSTSPQEMFATALNYAEPRADVRKAVQRLIQNHLAWQQRVFLSSMKGEISLEEGQRRYLERDRAYSAEMKSTLGEENFASFQAKIMAQPAYQVGMGRLGEYVRQNK